MSKKGVNLTRNQRNESDRQELEIFRFFIPICRKEGDSGKGVRSPLEGRHQRHSVGLWH
jgi:hypothetical protein